MGLNITLVVLLVTASAGSYFYINMQKAEIRQLQVELRHNLNDLGLARPESIQRIINAGTVRVNQQFVDLTNPRQFDATSVPE